MTAVFVWTVGDAMYVAALGIGIAFLACAWAAEKFLLWRKRCKAGKK